MARERSKYRSSKVPSWSLTTIVQDFSRLLRGSTDPRAPIAYEREEERKEVEGRERRERKGERMVSTKKKANRGGWRLKHTEGRDTKEKSLVSRLLYLGTEEAGKKLKRALHCIRTLTTRESDGPLEMAIRGATSLEKEEEEEEEEIGKGRGRETKDRRLLPRGEFLVAPLLPAFSSSWRISSGSLKFAKAYEWIYMQTLCV
ncbi:hypothetical protein KM043_015374 [Ampulex compressa]|nr:hypothetical protein KM043_015374 [Ampulex compressa]